MPNDVKAKPPVQVCDCGTEWFFVHTCPQKATSVPMKETIDFRQKYKVMVEELIGLRQLCRDQEKTITDLMLELADLRDLASERREAMDRRS